MKIVNTACKVKAQRNFILTVIYTTQDFGRLMEFRISDTFTDSLAKLNGQEQKTVKTTAFDLQIDPSGKGKSFHRIDKTKDPNFWSVRVNRDIRLIVHKADASLLLCYVDHHDNAYEWAERRKIERHPKTGAAQLGKVRETVKEITIPKYVEVERPVPPMPALFAVLSVTKFWSFLCEFSPLSRARF